MEDTRLHVKRALKEADVNIDELFLDSLDLKFLVQYTEDLYYRELDEVRHSGGDIAAIHKVEKLELAMSLARNLLHSNAEVHHTEVWSAS